MRVEGDAKKKLEKGTETTGNADWIARINSIAEAIQSLISTKILIPMLRLFLSGEYREKLQEHRKDYAELLRLNKDSPDASVEMDTHLQP